MRVRLGTFGSVPTIFGILPNVVGRHRAFSRMVREYWQGASLAGKVPILDSYSAMRGVPLHVYYINFGQYTHPMGSDRPPWAAGEYYITYLDNTLILTVGGANGEGGVECKVSAIVSELREGQIFSAPMFR